MAIPKIKATYSLDAETVGTLERVARRWGVSKSEALRRAIHAAAEAAPPDTKAKSRLERFDELQRSLGLDVAAADAWVAEVRAEREATDAGRRYWPEGQ